MEKSLFNESIELKVTYAIFELVGLQASKDSEEGVNKLFLLKTMEEVCKHFEVQNNETILTGLSNLFHGDDFVKLFEEFLSLRHTLKLKNILADLVKTENKSLSEEGSLDEILSSVVSEVVADDISDTFVQTKELAEELYDLIDYDTSLPKMIDFILDIISKIHNGYYDAFLESLDAKCFTEKDIYVIMPFQSAMKYYLLKTFPEAAGKTIGECKVFIEDPKFEDMLEELKKTIIEDLSDVINAYSKQLAEEQQL